MCQKLNTMKRFFVVLNHPAPLQRPLVLGVVKQTHHTVQLYETSRNELFLTPKTVESLGIQPPKALKAYLVPIEIPKEWFIH
jgi:hypothetical protein